MLFEALWMRGLSLDLALTPQHAATSPNGGADGEILPLLAAGMKDEAIARQLGVSLRTVRRWVGRLMTQYGVATRFQLGLAIARQVGPWETDR
jgi:DNA-binding NarL/FixJ family response regulator